MVKGLPVLAWYSLISRAISASSSTIICQF
jgi:hypothetical protein